MTDVSENHSLANGDALVEIADGIELVLFARAVDVELANGVQHEMSAIDATRSLSSDKYRMWA